MYKLFLILSFFVCGQGFSEINYRIVQQQATSLSGLGTDVWSGGTTIGSLSGGTLPGVLMKVGYGLTVADILYRLTREAQYVFRGAATNILSHGKALAASSGAINTSVAEILAVVSFEPKLSEREKQVKLSLFILTAKKIADTHNVAEENSEDALADEVLEKSGLADDPKNIDLARKLVVLFAVAGAKI